MPRNSERMRPFRGCKRNSRAVMEHRLFMDDTIALRPHHRAGTRVCRAMATADRGPPHEWTPQGDPL